MPTRSITERALLVAIIVASGYFHFHGLDWDDGGSFHPDEMAVRSQTYDMMVRDDFVPGIHSWGHLGYYVGVCGYKAYLHFQHWANGIPVPLDARMQSVAGPELERHRNNADAKPRDRVPHFRDLVFAGWAPVLGVTLVLAFTFAGWLVGWVSRYRLPAMILLALSVLYVWLRFGAWREMMLVPVQPHNDDVMLLGRFLMALCCMLCVPIIHDIGRRLYSPATGLWAAAFFAFTVLGVQLSHFFAVDMVQTLCVLLAIWPAAAIISARANPDTNATPQSPGPEPRGPRTPWLSGVALPFALRYVLRVNHSVGWRVLLLYLAMGYALGLSMAAKFSSAPLFVLPFVTHLLFLHHARAARHLMPHLFLVLSYVAALAAWYQTAPYTWQLDMVPHERAAGMRDAGQRWLHTLFAEDYAKSIHEQSRMVKLEGGGPWVQQFAQTTPYVTITMQMIRWTFGWPLGLVCVGGFFLAMLRNVWRPHPGDLLLLSWAAVEFAIIGQFKAAFPRYTMAIIPMVCLFGAAWVIGPRAALDELTGRLRRVADVWRIIRVPVAVVALLSGILYCMAYMQVYNRYHTNNFASLWIFKNVEPTQPDGGRTLDAVESWDHSIPRGLSTVNRPYTSVRMEIYGGEGPSKVQRLARDLARLHMISLPTTRLYGTTMTVPEKYDYTIRYYKMLFAGQLGFTLKKTVTRPATLFGREFDDMLADESHRVYDHPKSVIFLKTEQLSEEELYERIMGIPPEIDALTRTQIMRWQEAPRQQLRNIYRDPYPDDGVLSEAEVRAVIGRFGMPNEDIEPFMEGVARLRAVPSVSVEDLRRTIDAVELVDRQTLSALRSEIGALSTAPAYRVRDVQRLLRRQRIGQSTFEDSRDQSIRVMNYNVQRRLFDALRQYLGNEFVEQRVARDRVARVDLRAGMVPTAIAESHEIEETAVVARTDPGRTPLITQREGGLFYQTWLVVKWLLLLQLLSLAILPLCCRMFGALPDMGYPLTRILGWLTATYLVWLLVNWGLGYFTWWVCLFAFIVVLAAGWLTTPMATLAAIASRLGKQWRMVLATEFLFFGTFFVFLAIRVYNPEIVFGETTMDMSFYNTIMRGMTFPPYEPWFSGELLNYYYYGYILFGYLTMLTVTPTPYAYNLAMVTVPALTVLCAFSLVYNITQRVRFGLWGAAFVGFLGNLDPAYQMLLNRGPNGSYDTPTLHDRFNALLGGGVDTGDVFWLWRPFVYLYEFVYELGTLGYIALERLVTLTFGGDLFLEPSRRSMWDSYWDASRAMDGRGSPFNEFPVWSFLFGDLHAHMIVMPISLLVLCFCYLVFVRRHEWGPLFGRRPVDFAAFGMLALAVGTLPPTNIWDALSYTTFLGLVLLSACWLAPPQGNEAWFPAYRKPTPAGMDAKAADPFLEFERPPVWLMPLLGLGFIGGLLLLWPRICDLHPYWLGCVNNNATALLIGVGVVAAATLRPSVLSLTDRISWGGWIAFRRVPLRLALVVGLGIVLYYHFHAHLQTESATIKPNVDGNIFIHNALRHFGLFAVMTLAWVVLGYYRAFVGTLRGERDVPNPILPAIVGIVLTALIYKILGGMVLEGDGIYVYALMLGPLLSMMLLWRTRPEVYFTGLLLLAGWGIAAMTELIVIMDRMNTVFKLYHHAWMLLALGSAAALGVIRLQWMGRVLRRPGGPRGVILQLIRAAACVVFLILVYLALACSIRGTVGVIQNTHGVDVKVPTLHGLDYLRPRVAPESATEERVLEINNINRRKQNSIELWEAVSWLNENVAGPQVIAEAFTNSGYDKSTRVSKMTGLPTLLGWPHHTKQRGRTDAQLRERQRDLQTLYGSDDHDAALEVARKYNVRYIFCGDFETRPQLNYNDPMPRLEQRPFLREVFRGSGGRKAIFEVVDPSKEP